MRDAFGVENPTISKREGKGRDAAYGAAGAAGGAAAGAVGMTAREGVRGIQEARGAVKAAKDLNDPDNFMRTPGGKGEIHAWYGGTTRGEKIKGVGQIAANPAYRKLLTRKTGAVVGLSSLAAGGTAAAAHHQLSKAAAKPVTSAARIIARRGTQSAPGVGEVHTSASALPNLSGGTGHRGAQTISHGRPATAGRHAAPEPGSTPNVPRTPASTVTPSAAAVDAGNQAVASARASNTAKEATWSRRKTAGVVAGGAAVGGAGVLGTDAIMRRRGRNKDAKVHL